MVPLLIEEWLQTCVPPRGDLGQDLVCLLPPSGLKKDDGLLDPGLDHAVLVDVAAQRLRESDIKELVATDSVPVPQFEGCPIAICSVANLLGEGIKRIHEDESVTSFNGRSV